MGTLSAEVRELGTTLSIKELITGANDHHNLAIKAARAGLQHAKDSGDMLTALKAKCQKGMFQKLITSDVDGLQMSLRTTQVYMEVSREYDKIMERVSPGQAANISLAEGIRLIKYKKDTYFPEEQHKDPVDGTEECLHGGPHEYDEEACIKCHDPRPDQHSDRGRKGTAAGTGRPSKSRELSKSSEEDSGGIPEASSLFAKAEGHYARLTQLLDQIHQLKPYHEKEGVQTALSLSYDHFSKWRKS